MGLRKMGKYATLNCDILMFSLSVVACIYEALIKDLKQSDNKPLELRLAKKTIHKKKFILDSMYLARCHCARLYFTLTL
jgi:hypothetical protein